MSLIKIFLSLFVGIFEKLNKVYSKKPIKENEIYRDVTKENNDPVSPFSDSDW